MCACTVCMFMFILSRFVQVIALKGDTQKRINTKKKCKLDTMYILLKQKILGLCMSMKQKKRC